jgi:alpha-beta hydrolase superfamily lysophospholipase
MPVPAWKRGAGELLRLLAPSLAISGPVPVDWLATRPGYAQEHKADHLRHSKICAHIYFGMREWGTRLLASAPRQNVPLFVLAGAHDRVVSPEAAAQLVATWGHPDATLHLIPEGGHEPLNDGYRDDLLQQIRSWIQSRVQKTNARHSTLETHPPNLLKYAT